ncbi:MULTISPECIES: MFS transporter [unclassified Corynebacterium]|uniref:MFS transporter n=1 Tax=unclassified Corynebacterium TaxID=2624378 RepID=UPI0034CF2CF0
MTTSTTQLSGEGTARAAGSAPERTAPATLRQGWIPLLALCLAFFVEMVDNSILTIALPTMGRDLGASTTQLQWVTSAYSLVFGALLLTAGTVADKFGRRRVLVAGLAAFGGLSALIWLVTGIDQLIALRAVLGMAAACMAPVTMSLVFQVFKEEKVRMRAISLMVVIGMSSMVAGPILAGGALGAVNWKWLVFINTPIALVAVAGVLWGVPRDEADSLHAAPIDWPGTVLTVLAMASTCFLLTSGADYGWTATPTVLAAVIAVASLAGFIWREKTARHPMVDLALFQIPTVRGAALAQVGSSLAQMGSMFLLIMHFQYALGWSPVVAGLANLPFIVVMLAAQPVAENLVTRFGHRVTCCIAAASLVVGLLVEALGIRAGYWVIALGMAALSFGLRIIMVVCAVALIESVPKDRTSLGTAINDVTQELGTSFGSAVVGTLLAVLVAQTLPAGAWSAEFTDTFFGGEQVIFVVLAVLVGLVAGYGCSTLTDSRTADEHAID